MKEGPVNAGDFSPDGKILALATGDRLSNWKLMVSTRNRSIHGWLTLVDFAKGKIVKSLITHKDESKAVKFSADGRILATGGGDGVVKLWDTATWKELCNLKGHEGGITSLAFSPDGKLLASADRYSVKLWDVPNRRELSELSKQLKGGNSVAFAPQGCILATGFEDEKNDWVGTGLEDEGWLFNPNPGKKLLDCNVIRLWQVRVSHAEKRPK